MDAHGQIGPEKGGYAQDVKEVAILLASETTYVRLADHGSQYRLLLTLRDLVVSLGDEDDQIDGVPRGEGFIHVAVQEHGAYWFQLGGFQASGYVGSKLGLGEKDGSVIGEFLTRLAIALDFQKETTA